MCLTGQDFAMITSACVMKMTGMSCSPMGHLFDTSTTESTEERAVASIHRRTKAENVGMGRGKS